MCKLFSAEEEFSSLFLDCVEGFKVHVDLPFGMEWAAKGIGIKCVSDLDGGVGFDKSFDELVSDFAVEKESSECGASLPAGAYCSEDSGFEGEVKVSIVHDHLGVIAS